MTLETVGVELGGDAYRPEYAHAGDAGMDLRASEDVLLRPGARALIKTGLKVAIPRGRVGLVVSRSGLALKSGITVLNAPGIIDSGYRGELGVILCNTDRFERFWVRAGDRIAQLVVLPVTTAALHFGLLSDGDDGRGQGGFGSTGVQ